MEDKKHEKKEIVNTKEKIAEPSNIEKQELKEEKKEANIKKNNKEEAKKGSKRRREKNRD